MGGGGGAASKTEIHSNQISDIIIFYTPIFFSYRSQTSINELDKDDELKYALFPGFQQRDRQPLPAILPPHDDIFQDADESQPLTSESQQNTPQHVGTQMMVTPAVSDFMKKKINKNNNIRSLPLG